MRTSRGNRPFENDERLEEALMSALPNLGGHSALLQSGRSLESALQSRRGSSRFASTSQRVHRAHYEYDTSDKHKQPQARAIALPWTDEDSWSSPQSAPAFAERASEAKEEAQKETFQNEKPLKLNRDLLLYRAKLARQNAFKKASLTQKLDCFKRAESALNRCIELDPVDPRPYVALGKLLLQQKRYQEARKVYEDGIAVTGGRNEYLWQAWATLEAKSGHTAQARKLYKAAVLVNPEHAASWHAWGMLEKAEGNFVAARDLWVKGIKKTQGKPNPFLFQSVAVLAGEMGFLKEARAWFKQGTSTVLGAQSHALWQAWAQLEERIGEPKVVRFLYKKGLGVSPRSRYIYLSWAMFEKLEGEVENARQLLQRGHLFNPKDAAILQAWAVLEEENGNVDEARRLFQQSVDADPQHTHAWQAWGMLELREGNLQRSRELFQSAVWSRPSNEDACKVWQAWSVLEFTAGNHKLAHHMCSCAVKADPTSDRAWESWIYQEEQLGHESQAIILRKARASGQTNYKLPASFSLPMDLSPEEPSTMQSIMNTVRDWVQKFDSKRSIAKRRPPTYLVPTDLAADPALLEQQSEDLPPKKHIMDTDSSKLDLPDLPLKYHMPRRGSKLQKHESSRTE